MRPRYAVCVTTLDESPRMAVPHERQLHGFAPAVQHAIGDLPLRQSDVDRDLITALQAIDRLPQAPERPQREVCAHAEAQLAHDGALGAVAELVLHDAARERDRAGDPTELVLPVDAIGHAEFQRVDAARLVDRGKRHAVADDGAVPDAVRGDGQEPRPAVPAPAAQEEAESPRAPGDELRALRPGSHGCGSSDVAAIGVHARWGAAEGFGSFGAGAVGCRSAG